MKTRLLLLLVVVSFLAAARPAGATEEVAAERREPVFAPVPGAASRSLELINRERVAAGLPTLALDDEVTGIADGWSRQMAGAGRLSHNQDYLSEESMRRLDASIVGENVAYADTVDTTHDLFMDSPPHRRNILHPDYRLVGIAAVRAEDGQIYLTQDFLTRNSRAEARPAEPPPPAPERPARSNQGRSRPAATRARTSAVRQPATSEPKPASPPPTTTTSTPTTSTTIPTQPAQTTPASAAVAPPEPPVSTPHPAGTASPSVDGAPESLLAEPAGVDHAQQSDRSSPFGAAFWRVAPLLGLALRPIHRRR